MGWIETVMQYAIFIVLGVCLACLAASIVVFYAYERRWQDGIERDAHAVMLRGLYKAPVREDTVSPRQRQGLRRPRHQPEDMQIVADEANARAYKNAA